jgi:magnesium transporter
MVRTRCYINGVLTDTDFNADQLSEHLENPGAVVWVDMLEPRADELALIAGELELHELAVEDAIHAHQRPKLDRYSDHAFLSAYAVRFDPHTAQLSTHELAAFITPRALVTVREDNGIDIEAVMARWDSTSDLAKYGVAFLVHGLLDYVVDTHFQSVQQLDEEIENLEDLLFATNAEQQDVQHRSFELRKSLVLLRRYVLPMREVLNTLMRRDLHLVQEPMSPYFQDIYDHVLRATEWTESLRDLVTSVLETNLTIQGNRLNVITKKVTSWAAIIAVPTAITGFYGQNLPYPGFAQKSGLYASTLIIIVLSVFLYWLFKRKDWL